jgi:hypothetical protein
MAGMTLNLFFGSLFLVAAISFFWGAVDAKRNGKKYEMQVLAGLLFLASAIFKMWR